VGWKVGWKYAIFPRFPVLRLFALSCAIFSDTLISQKYSPTMATTDGIEVLDKGVGYGIVVGIGAFFALVMYVPRF
jgi:hypothetical protein